jgi:hypothetical protein
MYAFVSRTAAFRYGAAGVSFGVVTAYYQNRYGTMYFIGYEESGDVVVLLKRVNDCCKGIVLRDRPFGIFPVNLSTESSNVDESVYASICKDRHTIIVIVSSIDVIC